LPFTGKADLCPLVDYKVKGNFRALPILGIAYIYMTLLNEMETGGKKKKVWPR
jgi:hypothetical protein